MIKTIALATASAFTLAYALPATVSAQGTPNAADAHLLTEVFMIPQTDLVIDVPMAWSEMPPEMFPPGMFESLFGMSQETGSELAILGGQASGQDGFGIMIISDGSPFTRTPLQEVRTMEQGVKLSRLATWITGSAMAVVRPSRDIDMAAGSGATMSYLSGPEDAHDIVTLTIIKTDTDSIFIVDVADKDSKEAVVLDQMRASLRPQ